MMSHYMEWDDTPAQAETRCQAAQCPYIYETPCIRLPVTVDVF